MVGGVTRRPYSPTRVQAGLARRRVRRALPTAPVAPRRRADLPVVVSGVDMWGWCERVRVRVRVRRR